MDVPPPWYEDWERTDCKAEVRRCSGGDKACADAAERDGYVRTSLYSFCPKDALRHAPGTATWVFGSLLAAVVLVLGFRFSRAVRARRGG